ncbi:MAG: Gfo/Idh/MocA family oxidoreductase [Planctomycetaceae bacterium]
MDYLRESLGFKVRKVGRYLRLYGPLRTWAKVQAQRHQRRTFDRLPPRREPSANQTVALIGCGNYQFSTIAYYLNMSFGRVIAGCMDRNVDRAASLSRHYSIPFYTTDASELLDREQVRLVYIASNHASHAEYASEALARGKDVYIEKPHVVSVDQLDRLTAAMKRSPGRVYLGFNRPGSRLGRIAREYLSAESGPGMYNWFVAGHQIDPDHWYFRPEEGGRVLGNLCHWTDFLLSLVPYSAFPVRIVPTRTSKSDCDIAVTYTFGEGSIGAITFSAKGHTFEGVKERFSAHKGNVLLALDDFQRLQVEVIDRKRVYRNLFRDHGHQTNIVGAYENSTQQGRYDRDERLAYIANTALLFLKTKQALDENREITVESFARPKAITKAG